MPSRSHRTSLAGTLTLPGPRGPIRTTRDALGYPTIYARDFDDGTWARGWFHGHDRAAQLRLLCAAARGELMAILGDLPFARAVDRAARTLGLSRDVQDQLDRLRPETRAWLDRYADGVRAGQRARGRPLLLRAVGLPDEPFTAGCVLEIYRIVSYFGLTSMQHLAELFVAELVSRGAPREVFELILGDAARGLDLEALAGLSFPDEARLLGAPAGMGSNAFAVAGSETTSGGALLMGEFHMEVGRFPPALYASHTEHDDGTYLQGVGVPGFAWLSCGRTRDVAWSYVFGHADNVDVVAERCENGRYLAGDTWRPLRRREERVCVRGAHAPERWAIWENDYGVVLGDASVPGLYPCVRWAGAAHLAEDVETTYATQGATTVDELVEHNRRFAVLSLQGVFADSSGRIAEVHTGRVDERPEEWTGAYPYPGTRLPERAPKADEDARPPPTRDATRIVAANQRHASVRGAAWATLPEPDYRARRLEQTLAGVRDLHGMLACSYDDYDGCAARMLPRWLPLLPRDEDARLLGEWMGRASRGERTRADARALGLFSALHHELTRALLAPFIGAGETSRLLDHLGGGLLFQYHIDAALALERPDLVDEGRLEDLLAQAWPRARVTRPSAPIRTRFVDPITEGRLGRALGLSSAAYELPGGPCAPFQTREVAFEGKRLVFGPAFHYATDMRARGGYYHLPGGAAEYPTGPGYGAGVDLWARGELVLLGPPVEGQPHRIVRDRDA